MDESYSKIFGCSLVTISAVFLLPDVVDKHCISNSATKLPSKNKISKMRAAMGQEHDKGLSRSKLKRKKKFIVAAHASP